MWCLINQTTTTNWCEYDTPNLSSFLAVANIWKKSLALEIHNTSTTKPWTAYGNSHWHACKYMVHKLHQRYILNHLPVNITTVARKRSQSFCRKCRWQVPAKHACTLHMWLCKKQHDIIIVHGCTVYTERAKTAAVSHGTSHVTTKKWHQPRNNQTALNVSHFRGDSKRAHTKRS